MNKSAIILADRVHLIKPSPTLAVAAKAMELKAQGRAIISLSVGEPDFGTPENVRNAAIIAINTGKTRYTAVDGTPDLKKAIIQKLSLENQLDYELNQILVSNGAKQSIYNAMQALLNDGDEVIIPAPYWVSYPDMALLAGATPVCVPTTLEDRFKLTPDMLTKAITPKTKMIILNSPSNPSGMAYTKKELAELAQVLLPHPHIVIISDDIYEHILWGIDRFCNIVNACPELYHRTLVINGVSKAYAMTGWRIGYAAGEKRIISAMKNIQSQSTSNPCSISQYAATEALTGDQHFLKVMNKAFKERHDFVIKRINQIPGLYCAPTDGAFYVFVEASAAIHALPGVNDDIEFAEYLLTHANVACVPGSAFGSPGFVRLSYAVSTETLTVALGRIEKCLSAGTP